MFLFFQIFLAVLHGLWDRSFPTRDQTHTLGSESMESSVLDCWGISRASCSARRQMGLCLPNTCAWPHTGCPAQSQGPVCVQAPCRASSCFLWLSVCISWAKPTCEPTQVASPPCRAGAGGEQSLLGSRSHSVTPSRLARTRQIKHDCLEVRV